MLLLFFLLYECPLTHVWFLGQEANSVCKNKENQFNTLKTELLCRRLLNTSLLLGKMVLKEVQENRHTVGLEQDAVQLLLPQYIAKRRHMGTEIQTRKCDVLYVCYNFTT